MNDAQTWTTIGGLFTIMLAFMGLMTRMFGHTIQARFDALTDVMNARFDGVDKRFEQVDKRFEQIDKRFEQVEKRLDRIEDRVDDLDRDVSAIMRRLWDGPDQS